MTEDQRSKLIEEYKNYQSTIDDLAIKQNELIKINDMIRDLYDKQQTIKRKLKQDLYKSLLND